MKMSKTCTVYTCVYGKRIGETNQAETTLYST